jgi:hypothetical protein
LRYILLVAALFAGAPAFAAANDCRPEFVGTAATVTITGLEIGVGRSAEENVQRRVHNAGNGTCAATIRVANSGPFDPDAPTFELRSGRIQLDVLPLAGSAGTVNSDVEIENVPSNNQGRAVPFQITVPSGWGLKDGAYSEQLELSLLDSTGSSVDTFRLTINIIVPRAVALRIVGASGTDAIRRLNLGTLSSVGPTVSDPFGVRIWSTSPYRMTVRSANHGRLLHTNGSDQIEYRLTLDGELMNLTEESEVSVPGHTGSEGRMHPLVARVERVTAPAGDYHDRLTLTVSAT